MADGDDDEIIAVGSGEKEFPFDQSSIHIAAPMGLEPEDPKSDLDTERDKVRKLEAQLEAVTQKNQTLSKEL